MDLTREIGSLFIIGFQGAHIPPRCAIERNIVEGGLGGVILFDRCLHTPETAGNIRSREQLRKLTASLQAAVDEPLFICIDQEGGRVQRLHPRHGFFRCASPAEMGASPHAPAFTRDQASNTAAMLAAMGINVNFAPVVDLNCNPANPIIGALGRSFSADPEVVATHATTWIEAHLRHGIISCLKHFPGHGSSTADSHLGFVDITACRQDAELIPYRRLIASGHADMVMTGHLFDRGIDPHFPATLSRATITGLLRRQLGYKGVVVSDDMQMKAITDHYQLGDAVCKALAAGVDILVIGNNISYEPQLFETAVAAVQQGLRRGLISEKRLHAACARVKALKAGI